MLISGLPRQGKGISEGTGSVVILRSAQVHLAHALHPRRDPEPMIDGPVDGEGLLERRGGRGQVAVAKAHLADSPERAGLPDLIIGLTKDGQRPVQAGSSLLIAPEIGVRVGQVGERSGLARAVSRGLEGDNGLLVVADRGRKVTQLVRDHAEVVQDLGLARGVGTAPVEIQCVRTVPLRVLEATLHHGDAAESVERTGLSGLIIKLARGVQGMAVDDPGLRQVASRQKVTVQRGRQVGRVPRGYARSHRPASTKVPELPRYPMNYQLIASPYPDGHVAVRPGQEAGIRIGAGRYAGLRDAAPDAPVPDWLAAAALAAWDLDITGQATASTIMVRPETEYGYARASYELNLGCNYDCEHCYLGEKAFAGMEWPGRERLLNVMAQAGVLWLQLTGGEPPIEPLFV